MVRNDAPRAFVAFRTQTKGTLRADFLPWRDLVAELYRSDRTRPDV